MGLLPFDKNRTISLPLVFMRAYNETWCETTIYDFNTRRPENGSKGTTMQLVFTVVLMALMGCTLCIDGFMRLFVPRFTHNLRLFLGRFNLEPIARILLHFAFFQFLPLLSSVFSRAEGQETEVLLMLLWMLLVELIRKKVQGMLLPTNGSSFSRGIGRFTLMDYSDEASRLVWVGFLIYTTLGRINYHKLDAVFVILWSLGLLKLVQRVVNTWLASGSWHTARNPLLIAAYMQHVMEDHRGQQEMEGCSSSSSSSADPCDMLSECKFAVMGEEKLVRRDTSNCKERRQKKGWAARATTTPGYGYGVGRRVVPAPHQNEQHHGPSYCDQNEQKHVHLHLLIDDDRNETEPDKAKKEEKGLVTVGKIWKMHKTHKRLFCHKRRRHLEDLCLSFSLFKMLRRRFEHYPMVEVGSAGTRNLMLQGLLNLGCASANKDDHQRPFQVLQLELDILINYYQQAAAPVVMSQPILFFCNFVSSIIFLAIFIASVFYILLRSNNAAVLYCAAMGLFRRPHIIYLYIYLAITILLLVTVFSIETYEFWTLYVFSNWNIVRLICSYSSTAGLRQKFYFIIIAVRFCAHSIFCRWLTKTSIKVQQVSIVDACGALDRYSTRTTAKLLPAEATPSIINNLKDLDPRTGIVSLPQLEGLHSGGETTSTEIIVACHLATELLEMTEHRPMTKVESQHKEVASVLSKYCMYLVAHVPQLLPDDETWIADRHEDVRSFLEEHASTCNCGCFIFCALTHDCRKENAMRILELRDEDLQQEPTTLRGVKLFRELEKRTAAAACNGRDDIVWKELATFWVRLLIYLAPSNDVQGHAKALATWGSDLMTCLWAFCTHAGITRQPLDHNTGAMCV